MKQDPIPSIATPATLQDVIDRLAGSDLPATRKRDLRSAVETYAKLMDRAPAAIPLDLANIRQTLDSMVPVQAKVSRKRWANLRSDFVAAFDASGLRPMLKTAKVELDEAWNALFETVTELRIRNGLSRFARWASLRQIAPEAVNDAVVGRFVAELQVASLIRNIDIQHRNVALIWNILCAQQPGRLLAVQVPSHKLIPTRVAWERLPVSFCTDVDQYLAWCAVPDPLDEQARARALARQTLRLHRDQIHSAVTAASGAGIDVDRLTSLASLVEPDAFRALLRQRWMEEGRALSAYTHGVAGTLIAIATEWVQAPADVIATLKHLRRKLGPLPSGMTEKNKNLLRQFDDPDLCEKLAELPDRLWQQARRELPRSKRAFIDLQSALAIDLLIHVAPRMENLAALSFNEHLHWPRGRGQPALLVFAINETKNEVELEFEIPKVLADRLQGYRNEIAPAVTGTRPDAVFVTSTGRPRSQAAITVAVEKVVLRLLGVKLTPHQFRHLLAKIHLDANPGAYEGVRQLLGHKNMKTTTNFYAGIDSSRRTSPCRPHHAAQRKQNRPRPPPSDPRATATSQAAQAMRGLVPRLHLPFARWPAADQRLWARAMEHGDDPFADAPGARLALATKQKLMFAWRRFLGFLALHEPSALVADPAERLTVERVRGYRAHLAETNAPQSVAMRVDELYQSARMLMPQQDWTWLKVVKARLYKAVPARGRSGPVITSVQLLELGLLLMDESKPVPGAPIHLADAIRYRDGLMFALVAFNPLRRKNLAALEIGRHLIRQGGDWFLVVPGTETKDGSPIDAAIPELLTPYLAIYLDVVRPRMLRQQACKALWVSPCGDALGYSAIWPIFTRHSTRRLGIHIAPHDCRDAGATTWAIAAPDQIGVARDLLGHSDLRPITRHYNRARGIEASRAHALVVKELRRKSRNRRP